MTQQEPAPTQIKSSDDRQSVVIEPTPFAPSEAQIQSRHWRPSRRQLTIVVPLFFGVLAVLFLLLSRSVTFITLPATADISVSGGLQIKLANAWLLLPGEYQVAVRHPGYQPLQQAIQIGDQAEQQIRLELTKLPGRLLVALDNADINAEVWLDEQPVGHTGREIADVSPGLHTLRITHPRHLPHEQNITLEGKDLLHTVTLQMLPAWATVQVTTIPAGAHLHVGEEQLGTTPGSFEIMHGEQQLMLQLPGYKIWQDVVEFKAGESLSLPEISLRPADGTLALHTQPTGASVTLNSNFLGQTPLDIALVPDQQHHIKVFKEGYQEAATKVTIDSGGRKTVNLTLEPSLGKVAIAANFSDAELYVDGRLFGRANQTLSLPARPHAITVKKEGYESFEAEVTPKPALTQQLRVKLRTLDQAKWDKIPKTLRTTTGQQLTLFRPNLHFTMGSSRREQGRRSNESMRQVALTRPFYVSPLLVTNADFLKFERFHSSSHVKGHSLFSDAQPVVNITWEQAARFCNWLSAQEKLPPFYQDTGGTITRFNADATGYRLLTEAEWSWLARVQDKDGMRKYPWGNQLPPPANAGNYGDRSAAALLGLVLLDYNDGYPVSSPVGKFAPNSKGIYDMGGNVSEWINDFYSVGTGLALKTETDPLGPEKGDYHVIRGSSWAHGGITELRLAYRDYGNQKKHDLGFRIARFVEPRAEVRSHEK